MAATAIAVDAGWQQVVPRCRQPIVPRLSLGTVVAFDLALWPPVFDVLRADVAEIALAVSALAVLKAHVHYFDFGPDRIRLLVVPQSSELVRPSPGTGQPSRAFLLY